MINIQICINNDNIASVFIVSPPPYNVGRDEPNNSLIALLAILLYYKLLKPLIFYNFPRTPLWIEIDGVLYYLPMPTTRRPQYTSEETS